MLTLLLVANAKALFLSETVQWEMTESNAVIQAPKVAGALVNSIWACCYYLTTPTSTFIHPVQYNQTIIILYVYILSCVI